jgi:hypothetical protein
MRNVVCAVLAALVLCLATSFVFWRIFHLPVEYGIGW